MSEFDPREGSASIVSVTDRVRPVQIGAPVVAAHFLGEKAAFVGAEETIALVDGAGEMSRAAVHGGGILCVASDGNRIVTGGDDGKVTALDARGEVTTLATDAKRRWRGRPARPRSSATKRRKKNPSTCRPPSAGSPSRRKACGSRSRITTA
jgi:hypothetical protein